MFQKLVSTAAAVILFTVCLASAVYAVNAELIREGSAHLKPCPACGISDNKQPAVFVCDAGGRPLTATVTCTHCGAVSQYQVRSNAGGGGLVNVQLTVGDLIVPDPQSSEPEYEEYPEEPPVEAPPAEIEPPIAVLPPLTLPPVETIPPNPPEPTESTLPEVLGQIDADETIDFITEESPLVDLPPQAAPEVLPEIGIEPIDDTLEFETDPLPTTGTGGRTPGITGLFMILPAAVLAWRRPGAQCATPAPGTPPGV